MAAKIPVLNDIIETGDDDKAGLHQSKKQSTEVFDLISDDELSQKINQAIDAALPQIKQRLHQELLDSLSKK